MLVNFTLIRKTFWLGLLFVCTTVFAEDITLKWERITPQYETSDAVVIALNVLDYGADPTGTTDQTMLFQSLLDALGSRSRNNGTHPDGTPNGGVLFVPEGKYLFSHTNTVSLTIPKGVTIRGEWEKPVKGQAIKGTILMVKDVPRRKYDVDENPAYESRSFFILQPSAAVRDLNIWYPDQNPDDIKPYTPAILFGQSGYWGNDYTLASNITLVNAYDGVIFSRRNGGGAPNCHGIYGTPLKRGIEIDNIAEVGRIDNVDFSPDYWPGSGLPGSPSIDGPHKDYIRQNGTAVVMRRNDWSFINKVRAEGYRIGYRLDLSYNTDNGNRTSPNGHNYGMEFTDCTYGVYSAAVAGAGMMFYEYKFNDCDFGFYIPEGAGGIVQIQGCEFNTKKAALYATQGNTTKIIMNQCTIEKGAIDIRSGLTSIINCNFTGESEHVILGSKAIAAITGNKFKDDSPKIKNLSTYMCIIDHTPVEMEELPHFPYKNQYEFVQKPSGSAFSLATANGVSVTNDDNSAALQSQLNAVKAQGGGVVFLPPGHYNFKNPITIPAGVELKGSMDTPSLPTGPGSVMEIYAGKGDENGTPFITMEEGSGIRGLVMNYPEQIVQLLTEPDLNGLDVYKFPYTIRGNKDVYIVNIALRACYRGLDLFTEKCDNHFVDYLAGHVFKNGIRVGGGSKNGHIYNSQFNQIAYGSGGETKFGAWPNSPDNTQADQEKYRNEHDLAYAYCWNHLDFLVLEDCEDQVLYNNFDFGSNRGFVLAAKSGKAPSGICLGQGIDQGMNAFYIGAVDNTKGFRFINSQIVTTAPGRAGDVLQEYKDNNRYIQVDPAFDGKVTFFAADFWGQPQNISNDVLNGTIELQAGNFSNSGQRTFASIADNAAFKLIATNVNPINSLITEGSAPQFYVESSLINKGSLNTEDCGLWLNNLGFSGQPATEVGDFIDRTGWIATASVRNEDANKSLDGDVSTRWSTMSENQRPGQWFKVDMLEDHDFTGIVMESGNNTAPAGVEIYVSSNDVDWTLIASGNNVSEFNFATQTARYIKIEQTSSRSSAWRIAEFYVTDLPFYDYTSIQIPSIKIEKGEVNAYFASGRLVLEGTTGVSVVRIYTISGQQIVAPATVENAVTVNIPSGIYVAVIENDGKVYRKKLLK
ncbi:MAG: discoidin domain-containing protein [Dysgonamonadaceae bacterium]|jgi:hypothetical protein|nr:discoidin domain-containing protein [Dysgonamonadaceae bacterium]